MKIQELEIDRRGGGRTILASDVEFLHGAWHCAGYIAHILSCNSLWSISQAGETEARELMRPSKITQLHILSVDFKPTFF